MIVQRKPRVTLACHPDGRVGIVVHPKNPSSELVYVRLGGHATANWPRSILVFRFVHAEMQDESAGQASVAPAH